MSKRVIKYEIFELPTAKSECEEIMAYGYEYGSLVEAENVLHTYLARTGRFIIIPVYVIGNPQPTRKSWLRLFRRK